MISLRSSLNRMLAYVRFRHLRGVHLVLEEGVHFASPWRSVISCPTRISRFTRINGPVTIRGEGEVMIGKYAAVGPNLTIIVSNHDMRMANVQIEFQRRHGFGHLVAEPGRVTIGNNVWIGESVTILSGVEIGDGAVIGAGSVVTRDISAFSIAAGVPARVTRKRFSDQVVSQLSEIKWWDWSEEKIQRNREFFVRDLTRDPGIDLSSVIV